MDKKKVQQFHNSFPAFTISGKYEGNNILELDGDCASQVCSSPVDFFPKWSIKGNKVILEFTPKLVYGDGTGEVKMTLQDRGKK